MRNDNSSRFGKHFDVQFNDKGQILGAFTSTYLLEKPRITEHMRGERNYHIFYVSNSGSSTHLTSPHITPSHLPLPPLSSCHSDAL